MQTPWGIKRGSYRNGPRVCNKHMSSGCNGTLFNLHRPALYARHKAGVVKCERRFSEANSKCRTFFGTLSMHSVCVLSRRSSACSRDGDSRGCYLWTEDKIQICKKFWYLTFIMKIKYKTAAPERPVPEISRRIRCLKTRDCLFLIQYSLN